LPPDDNQKAALNALAASIPALARVNTELKATRGFLNTIGQDIETSSLKVLSFFNEIQELQKKAVKEIGFTDFNTQIDRSINLFKELNSETNDFAILQENITQTIFDLSAAFEATGINLGNLDKGIAANSNLVERSKLVDFVRDLSFQQKEGSQIAGQFTNRLIGLSVALKRPPAELLNLTQGLLSSNATFAQSERVLERLAIRSTEVGRRFNTTTDSLNKALDVTFTIQQRQQQASRISQIAGRLNIAPDTSGLMSSDPETRQRAIVKIISQLNQRAQSLNPSMRAALVAALGQTVIGTALGPKGLRTLGQRSFNVRDIEARATATSPTDIDTLRRGAATTRDVLTARTRAKEIAAAQEQLAVVARQLNKNNVTLASSTEALGQLMKDQTAAFTKMAGEFAEKTASLVVKLSAIVLRFAGVIDKLPASARGPLMKDLNDMKRIVGELVNASGGIVSGQGIRK
tara:strand:+ start:7960 stop:9348 length:1389 start_codon:yes stop_codon:yes gene_type:complete